MSEELKQEKHMDYMRARSGTIQSNDPLVSFLYILIRDHLPPGIIEEIMLNHVEYGHTDSVFTNGWLANYCMDIAGRIRQIDGPRIKDEEV